MLSQSGRFILTYWSVDVAGNHEVPRQVDISIDAIAPTIDHSLSIQPNASGWHAAPVTVTFHCADGLSGVAGCSEPQQLATDGVGQVVIGTAEDVAGNRATETVTINLDQTRPVIAAERTPAANANGWNNRNVVIDFTCSDATSGVATCPEARTVGEGANQHVTETAVDLAGNTGSVSVSTINVDLTAPSISASVTTAAGTPYVPGHWANQTVTVTYTCSDALSTIAICPTPQTFGEGAGQIATGTAYDHAGNSASVTVAGINVDLTAPTLAATLTTADLEPYTPGAWAQQPVTVTFQCADTLSQVAMCSTPVTFTDGTGQSLVGSATDLAGNTTSLPVEQINVDTIAPTILAVATTADGQPYPAGTWTNQTVTIAFTCDDATSGLAGPCPAAVVVSASTSPAGQIVSAQISDLAGHVSVSHEITVKVDLVAPTFTFTPADIVVEATDAGDTVVTWETPLAVDDLAGDIAVVCLPGSGTAFEVGSQTITCSATDPASNVATTSFLVTIVEPPPPTLTVPDAIMVPADGPWGAIVHYDAVTSDIPLSVGPVCTAESGSRFAVGTTIVRCHGSNLRGTQTTASFTVTVRGGAELLAGLRDETDASIGDPAVERVLLIILGQADGALRLGDTDRAAMGMQKYRMQLRVYARAGLLAPADLLQFQTQAEAVIDALR